MVLRAFAQLLDAVARRVLEVYRLGHLVCRVLEVC